MGEIQHEHGKNFNKLYMIVGGGGSCEMKKNKNIGKMIVL